MECVGTRMSLSDRFTLIRKQAQQKRLASQNVPRPTAQLREASEANRRLANKMASDLLRSPAPIVQSPMQTYTNLPPVRQQPIRQLPRPSEPPKRTLKERLGSASKNIKNRLGEVRKPIGQRIGLRTPRSNLKGPELRGKRANFKAKKAVKKPLPKQGKKPKLNQKELDEDLDSYMMNTRTRLNADIDSYFSTR